MTQSITQTRSIYVWSLFNSINGINGNLLLNSSVSLLSSVLCIVVVVSIFFDFEKLPCRDIWREEEHGVLGQEDILGIGDYGAVGFVLLGKLWSTQIKGGPERRGAGDDWDGTWV